MAFGSKLGKVFGAIGSGLSFVPGPWSALGAVLGAAGGIASSVGAKKEQEAMEEEEVATPQPAAPVDNQRPGQGQLQLDQPQQLAPNTANLYSGQQGAQGGYQSQMQSAIANLILKGDINDLGGV